MDGRLGGYNTNRGSRGRTERHNTSPIAGGGEAKLVVRRVREHSCGQQTEVLLFRWDALGHSLHRQSRENEEEKGQKKKRSKTDSNEEEQD